MLRPEHLHALSSQFGLCRLSAPQPFSSQLYLLDAADIFDADTLAIYPALALTVARTNRASHDPTVWRLSALVYRALAASEATGLNFASGHR
jgi:hypothetical protein